MICDKNHSNYRSQLLKLFAVSRYGWPGDVIAALLVRHHPVPWRGRGKAEVTSDPTSDPGQWSASTSPSISVLQPRWASIGRQYLLDFIVFINYQRSFETLGPSDCNMKLSKTYEKAWIDLKMQRSRNTSCQPFKNVRWKNTIAPFWSDWVQRPSKIFLRNI